METLRVLLPDVLVGLRSPGRTDFRYQVRSCANGQKNVMAPSFVRTRSDRDSFLTIPESDEEHQSLQGNMYAAAHGEEN